MAIELENTLAKEFVKNIISGYPRENPSNRKSYLQEKQKEYRNRIDIRLLNSDNRKEKAILDFLVNKEKDLEYDRSFKSRVRYLTGLEIPFEEYEIIIGKELSSIEKKIFGDSDLEETIPDTIEAKKNRAVYFENDDVGRQEYLDRLSQSFMASQNFAALILENYSGSSLDIVGTENHEYSFLHNDGTLKVNLSDLKNLPEFEIASLTAFYGLPGLGALKKSENTSLAKFLKIPAYHFGWAAFALELLFEIDVKNAIDYAHFSRMLSLLALTDLKTGTDTWNWPESQAFLLEALPYGSKRIAMLLNHIKAEPGHYLAIAIGRYFFQKSKKQCMENKTVDFCGKKFNQIIIDSGPVPLSYLREIISDYLK